MPTYIPIRMRKNKNNFPIVVRCSVPRLYFTGNIKIVMHRNLMRFKTKLERRQGKQTNTKNNKKNEKAFNIITESEKNTQRVVVPLLLFDLLLNKCICFVSFTCVYVLRMNLVPPDKSHRARTCVHSHWTWQWKIASSINRFSHIDNCVEHYECLGTHVEHGVQINNSHGNKSTDFVRGKTNKYVSTSTNENHFCYC